MAFTLRDVMAHPCDADGISLLMHEYHKYCIGLLDDRSDISGDEEDSHNNNDGYQDMYDGLLYLDDAFNVRSLTRVEFPRTWIIPVGTIPASYYTDMAVHGGKSMLPLVDYSQLRCVVNIRSELLRLTQDGDLPQKVLAVWPDDPPRLTSSSLSQGHDSHGKDLQGAVLYWPAYVTRVVGVFDHPLLDGSLESHAKLRAYDDFNDILVQALRAPMRLCVDVVFCIDEISEARRLTIAPAICYPLQASTAEDPEIMQASEQASAMMKGNRSETMTARCEAQCPLLVPHVMPQVVSIRNYSYTAVVGRGRRMHGPLLNHNRFLSGGFSAGNEGASSLSTSTTSPDVDGEGAGRGENGIFSRGKAEEDCNVSFSLDNTARVAATRSSETNPAVTAIAGNGDIRLSTASGFSRTKLNHNTLSHSPISLLDMLAGPICQTRQFVLLRPTVRLAVAAQQAAIEEIRALWQRLLRAPLGPLYAEEMMPPSAPKEKLVDFATARSGPQVQLPDPQTYERPYIQGDVCNGKADLQPLPLVSANAPSYVEVCCRLPMLQGHGVGLCTESVWRRRIPPTALPDCERDPTAADKRGQKSERKSATLDISPSVLRKHDSDSDVARTTLVSSLHFSMHWEGGTDAGPVGGPSRTQSRTCSVNVAHFSGPLARTSLQSDGGPATPPLQPALTTTHSSPGQQSDKFSNMALLSSPSANKNTDKWGQRFEHESTIIETVDKRGSRSLRGTVMNDHSPLWMTRTEPMIRKWNNHVKELQPLIFEEGDDAWRQEHARFREQQELRAKSCRDCVHADRASTDMGEGARKRDAHSVSSCTAVFSHRACPDVSTPSVSNARQFSSLQRQQPDVSKTDSSHLDGQRVHHAMSMGERHSSHSWQAKKESMMPLCSEPEFARSSLCALPRSRAKNEEERGEEKKAEGEEKRATTPPALMHMSHSLKQMRSATQQRSTTTSPLRAVGRAHSSVRSASLCSLCTRCGATVFFNDGSGEETRRVHHRHPTSGCFNRAMSGSRSVSAGTAERNRFAFASWRDVSGVEITLDDARLLPSALATEDGDKTDPWRPKDSPPWACCGKYDCTSEGFSAGRNSALSRAQNAQRVSFPSHDADSSQEQQTVLEPQLGDQVFVAPAQNAVPRLSGFSLFLNRRDTTVGELRVANDDDNNDGTTQSSNSSVLMDEEENERTEPLWTSRTQCP